LRTQRNAGVVDQGQVPPGHASAIHRWAAQPPQRELATSSGCSLTRTPLARCQRRSFLAARLRISGQPIARWQLRSASAGPAPGQCRSGASQYCNTVVDLQCSVVLVLKLHNAVVPTRSVLEWSLMPASNSGGTCQGFADPPWRGQQCPRTLHITGRGSFKKGFTLTEGSRRAPAMRVALAVPLYAANGRL